tara:strand:- start:2384 stop:4843 length:2460 start_codon:yes stop_codon:yes gene_type:complete
MKHNRNQFNLLMERMSNRYSYDESIDLINKQLLTEGFGNTFFRRLKGIDVNLRTPQINRLQKVMGGLDEGLTKENIRDLINAKGPDGNSGINLIKNDLKKANISLNKIEENGLDNYFKVLGGVDDALQGRIDNSVIGVINRLDDTNLTLKQKQKYLTEVFEENPELINRSMPASKQIDFEIIDGRVRMKKNNITDVVEDNFLYLSSNSVKDFVNESIIKFNGKTPSPMNIIKGNDFEIGDILISKKDSKAFFSMKAEDATTNVQTKLKSEGYDVFPVDKPSGKFKEKVENQQGVPIFLSKDELAETFAKGLYLRKIKFLKVLGIIDLVQIAGFIIECMIRMGFDDYKEWNPDAPIEAEDKYTITKNYDISDCFRIKVVDAASPDPISRMKIPWWAAIIPGAPIAYAVFEAVTKIGIDITKVSNDLDKIISGTANRAFVRALEKLSIKQIVNYDCETPSRDIISGVIKPDSEQEILNNLFETITGFGGVDPETISNAIDEGIAAFGGAKSDYEDTMDKIEIDISNNNEGLEEKYQMKNFGMLERAKHYCRRQKLSFIKKKINIVTEQSKTSEGNTEKWCAVNTAKLDIYSPSGFKIGDNPKSGSFSVGDCKDTKKEITQLITLAYNNKPEEAEGLENLDILSNCDDAELKVLKSNQDSCYIPPDKNEALKEILKDFDDIEVKVVIHKKDVSNKYYDWQYDKDNKDDSPLKCSQLQSIFIGTTNGSKKNEIITKLSNVTSDDGTIIEAELKEGVDWEVRNKRVVYNINEKNIRFFENNYTYFCTDGRRNTVDGVKNTKEVCINDLVTHVKTMGCWGEFAGS